MSPRNFVKQALPWVALVLAIAALGYTWRWALSKSSDRQRMHHAFSTGTTDYIFSLCPSTPLAQSEPRWASDMRGRCVVHQPTWGTAQQGGARPELDIEKGSTWQSLQLLSRLVLEISPGKMLSLLSLVVISLAGTLGVQRKGWLERQGLSLSITRGAAVSMLTVVLVALSVSLVLLDEQETLSMCQVTSGTYANLLSVDTRCSQQTMLLRETQEKLEQKKGELDARAQELEELKREIASLGVMRDALGSFKTELQSQSESTQQLIRAVTGATLEGINKALDPIHADVKGLDTSLKTDFKKGLRGELQEDMTSLVRAELKTSLQGEQLQELIRREVRAALREDLREVVRGELRESVKAVLAASPAVLPPAPKPETKTPARTNVTAASSKPAAAPGRKPSPPPAPSKR
ncbi:hypothetical protein CYFUS_008794 [Cystobacter fuscus]|uniref:Uncharacterized protein n=1 Tax=Cystobacter fuscus TaxID=43 RepID=A0A250JHE4_9BACT|nr:hypothetical protein [Cystobacter fuscus]ATB43314.1 hypothetical protein CYFUS_008794 [Cystobacter fuscus]